jgi:hypothetical protein
MLTVHKMPLKNQFPTGISSGYDKTPNQNEPQPFTSLSFTGDCTFDFLGKERCQRVTDTFAGNEIIYNLSTKQDVWLMACTGDFNLWEYIYQWVKEKFRRKNFMTFACNGQP